MTLQVKKILKSKTFIVAFLFYMSSGPFFFWPLFKIPHFSVTLEMIISLLLLSEQKKISIVERRIIALYIFAVLLFALSLPNPFFVIPFVPLFLILFIEDTFSKKVYYYFETIYVLIMLPSIIVGLLLLLNIPVPKLGTMTPVHMSEFPYYIVYPFCVHPDDLGVRFFGPFDEPGVVGSFGALMLCVRKMKFNSWRPIIILISGIMAMSFFFFIVVVLYSIVIGIAKGKITTIFVMLISFGMFYFFTKEDSKIYSTIWYRFEMDDGKFKGDTRTTANADKYYKEKEFSLEYWFGYNEQSKEIYEVKSEGSSSYKNVVISTGMLFFICYCMVFIFLGFHCCKKKLDLLLYIMLFLGMTYQRTNLYSALTLYLYAMNARGGFINYLDNMKDKKAIS